MLVNRLSKWAVSMTQVAALIAGGGAVDVSKGKTHFACHLEIDISTGAEFDGELGPKQATVVLEELIKVATQIAEKGDIN